MHARKITKHRDIEVHMGDLGLTDKDVVLLF